MDNVAKSFVRQNKGILGLLAIMAIKKVQRDLGDEVER